MSMIILGLELSSSKARWEYV